MESGEHLLVTGSAGHLGEALMRTLRGAGRSVLGVDRLASPWTDVVGSIADREVVERCMRGVTAVLHTATLHKPHVATHTRQAFVDTNITGTLMLLEAARRENVGAFIFTSTTSAFGDALKPPPSAPTAWITEDVAPIARNIYGVTKVAAEDLCALAHRIDGMPCLVLRTSRFFPEPDDDPDARSTYADANLKVNEFVNRRVDLEDVVSAHFSALERAKAVGFGRYIISATTPFLREDCAALRTEAGAVLEKRVPGSARVFAELGWQLPTSLDRVYDNAKARRDLGWTPRHDFRTMLERARTGDIRGELAQAIGVKGYHGALYGDGVYPVAPGGVPPKR